MRSLHQRLINSEFKDRYIALKNQTISQFLRGSEGLMSHIWLLVIGIVIFVIFGILSYIISVKRFEKVDI